MINVALGKNPQKYKAVYTLFSLCFIFLLSGCVGSGDFPDARLLSGEVSTKNGSNKITRTEYWGQFRSSFQGGSMTIMPFKGVNSSRVVGTLEFWLQGERKNHTTFKPTHSFYQINKEPEVSIEVNCRIHNTSSNGNTKITCNYPLPNILSYPSNYHISEGMLRSTKAKLKPRIKDTYRFNMNFNYNEGSDQLKIDLKFKLKLKTKFYIGIPGGHP